MPKLRILCLSAASSWRALSTTSGTRRSTTSRVMAMAMTASLKNSTRSYSRFPALDSGFSAARARGWLPAGSAGLAEPSLAILGRTLSSVTTRTAGPDTSQLGRRPGRARPNRARRPGRVGAVRNLGGELRRGQGPRGLLHQARPLQPGVDQPQLAEAPGAHQHPALERADGLVV